jgi:hypothetical protein
VVAGKDRPDTVIWRLQTDALIHLSGALFSTVRVALSSNRQSPFVHYSISFRYGITEEIAVILAESLIGFAR